MKVIIDLVLDVFGPTIKFLNNECSTALLTDVGHDATMRNKVVPGIQEVTSLIMMYSALLDRGFSRDEFEKKIRSREPDGKLIPLYSKTCVKQPLSKRPKIAFQEQLSLNAGQKYCRMLQTFCNTFDLH